MVVRKLLLSLIPVSLLFISTTQAESGDVVFVTQPPFPADFATVNATFGNHRANLDSAPRGGDLYIRYSDGTLKNLTQAAGYGQSGLQGAKAIAVRDPSVSWDGKKVIFSMTIGAPSKQYDYKSYVWQLYEITGLGKSETPVITKVTNQPPDYNNVMPVYGSDDHIIFVSDRPRDGQAHLYPQRDEYESTATNSGLWSLDPSNGDLFLLDHAPSGDFDPIIDSFGRVIFTRWDHLQRDQQKDAGDYGTFDYSSEAADSVPTQEQRDIYPEARDSDDPDKKSYEELHTFNQFFPWMINQDGTEAETINHVGRQEIGGYGSNSRNDDSNLTYIGSEEERTYSDAFHRLREDPKVPGRYYAVNSPEFGTHASGQVIYLDGAPSKNPDEMRVVYVTHPDTAGVSDNPSASHSGLYRNVLPLSTGQLIASHTSNTKQEQNIGSTSEPRSRYNFRLKFLTSSGPYSVAGNTLTPGIKKTISYWQPDYLISYNDVEMWELDPVELIARDRPIAKESSIPEIEQNVFYDNGISIEAFKQFLIERNLALIVSRNLTTRDSGDKQQPFNLRITGGAKTIGASGKIYDVSILQIFQADLIRGYGGTQDPEPGRRVLARPLHDMPVSNPDSGSGIEGAVALGSDGSMAALVPARRALSWQLMSPSGEPIVRERYWLTFQPGEIRVCTSCHGVNTFDQSGHAPPMNSPQALAALISGYTSLPTPAPGTPRPSSDYSITFKSKDKTIKKLTSGMRFTVNIKRKNPTGASESLELKLAYDKCSQTVPIQITSSGEKSVNAKLPARMKRGKLIATLMRAGKVIGTATLNLKNSRSAGKGALRCKEITSP